MAKLAHNIGLCSVVSCFTGKTTLLRDVARLMSLPESEGGLGMSVVIVDTCNKIAGELGGVQRHGP